jgi:hypothetical protein
LRPSAAASPKAHVLDAAGRVAIAKFPSDSSDAWNVMAWEKVALDLARDAGVVVSDSQLIRIGDQNVLVIDRFDCSGTARIGYASAMTMLEASDGDQRSYDYTDTRASVDALMSVAAYFRLDASDALEVLAEVTRAVTRWRTVAKSHGLLQQDLDAMEPAFEHAEGERARALTRNRPARYS